MELSFGMEIQRLWRHSLAPQCRIALPMFSILVLHMYCEAYPSYNVTRKEARQFCPALLQPNLSILYKAQPRYAWASPLSAVWKAELSTSCVFYRRKRLSWAIHAHVQRTYITYRESAMEKVAEQFHNAHRE